MITTKGRRFKKVNTSNQDTVGTYTLDFSSLPDGNFNQEALSNSTMTVYQGSKVTNNGSSYLVLGRRANNNLYKDNVVLETKKSSRDQEVTWSGRGLIILRNNGYTGIYISVKAPGNDSNSIVIAVANLQENNITDNTYNNFYRNDDANALIATAGVGDGSGTYTAGCVGYDIYVKYNGVEILRIKHWDITNSGIVSYISNDGQYPTSLGYFKVTNFSKTNTGFSNIENNEIDPRDFGLVENGKTTGSMNISQPNKLILNSSIPSYIKNAIKVGTRLIVSVGGEAPFYGRSNTSLGIKGVGGVNFPLSFSTFDAMNAVNNLPDESICWYEPTGETYRCYSGIWYRVLYTTTVGQQTNHFNNYRIGTARAIPLVTTVTAISGLELTVSTPCQASTTDADVWIDSWPVLNSLLNGVTGSGGYSNIPLGGKKIVKIPSGDYVLSDKLRFTYRNNWELIGAIDYSTRFITCKGSEYQVAIRMGHQNDSIIKNFTFIGNFDGENHGTGYEFGGLDIGDGLNMRALNMKFYNMGYHIIGVQQATNMIADNFYIEWVKDPHTYSGWSIGLNGGSKGCTIKNFYAWHKAVRMPMYEAFGSYDNKFEDCTAINGWFASNSGVNMVMRRCNVTLEPGTLPANQVPGQPVFNINGNNGYGFGGGALMEDCNIVIWGADAKKNQQRAITVQLGRDGVILRNNRIEYKEAAANDAVEKYGVGIGVDGNNCIIEDNTIITLPAHDAPPSSSGNSFSINVNYWQNYGQVRTTGTVIKRNKCHAIDCAVDGPQYTDIPFTGSDANDVDFIHSNYQVVYTP